MENLGQIRQQYLNELSSLYDLDECKSLFEISAMEILGLTKTSLILALQQNISPNQQSKFGQVLAQLKLGRPLQQILGKAPFYGMEFLVNEHTLIPRPETEELVDWIIRNQQPSDTPIQLIDIGTGSGCIAISLKKHLPKATVTAVDISPEAIAIAKQNALNNNLQVDFRCLDILEWEYVFTTEQYDVIVSNPPYITQDEMKAMHSNVLQYEPYTALFVENDAPLLFYDYISAFALKHLKKGGKLYFEINQYLAQETKDLLIKKGFQNVQILQDINQADRMLLAYSPE